jgi:hypothetical protein
MGKKKAWPQLLPAGRHGRARSLHHYTPELEAARSHGGLQTNSFIRLRKLFREGRPVLRIDELGDAESILHNKLYLPEVARQLARHGMVPPDEGWDG